MKLTRIGLLVCSLNVVCAHATHAQPITLRITGDGEAGESINAANGTPFTLDVTFDELIRQDEDEMTSIFTTSGSADFSAGSITSFFETDEFIISAEKSLDGVELTLNGGSLLHDLTVNKRSPAAGTQPVNVDDLVGFYLDSNNQDADVVLGIDALLMGVSTATLGGDITSITLISEPIDGFVVVPPLLGSCDLNGDGLCNITDINQLMNEAATGGINTDITGDGTVNNADRNEWLALTRIENGLAGPHLVGDSNLDGTVDSTDLNNLALSWQAADAFNWTEGNLSANGSLGVNSADLNALALNWQRSSASAVAVAEPSALGLLLLATLLVSAIRRRPGPAEFS